jgi:hypothetical protein
MPVPEHLQNDNDRRVANDIAEYGCHVISVFDPKQEIPGFSYSIGIQQQTGEPEAIVVGVRPELGHAMINHYNIAVRSGTKFVKGTPYEGFLTNFNIYVEPARSTRLIDYTLGCTRYYADAPYSVVQLVYPTVEGVWPWHAAASEWFKNNQPMLGRKQPQRRR